MDVSNIESLITSLGFPIACVIGLACFVVYVIKTVNTQNQKHLENLQSECKEREEKLYEQIKENTAINGKFAEIIAKYDTKLDNIEHDVKDIKHDITVIKTRSE